ncbi:metal-dependent hydrolase [Candidatus Gracilibacteria bacterium]|nr:metal-dependent hydrolase [Candidatus Gracilibacteria bacterium]
MLAINHVTLATAATFGASIYFDKPFFLPFIVFVTFSSLLPDVDHPGSEVSNYFPFVNKVFKHRGVTHSFLV